MDISDEILGAYIDNELDAVERIDIQERLTTDTELRARACELWQLKQMLRGAYPLPGALPGQKSALARRHPAAPRWIHALAASLLLALGAVTGWIGNTRFESERQATSQIDEIRAQGGRALVHLFSDEPARMEAALSLAERLAAERDEAGRPFRVEFLANGPGLHLLRAGGSPYAAQIEALRRHENLRLVACRQAIARMQERGLEVNLLPGVEEAVSAENELAQRLTQGWRYVQS
jgi:intracellular sulfur oxidation DsrE/DsrF family protein